MQLEYPDLKSFSDWLKDKGLFLSDAEQNNDLFEEYGAYCADCIRAQKRWDKEFKKKLREINNRRI